MILKMSMSIMLLVSLTSYARSASFPISTPASAPSQCSIKIQGGVDGFPWSIARPFPWTDIQGIWKLKDGVVPYYLKAKIIRTTTNRKTLKLMIVSDGDCSRPVATGVGFIDFSEKNVVRAIISDGMSKYQMKLALFNIKDLAENAQGCDEDVMAASLQVLGTLPEFRSNDLVAGGEEGNAENIMLKKVSKDLSSICKKLGTR